MLSAGANIQSANEPLKKLPVKYLYDALRSPRESIQIMLRQLRIVRQLNPSQYSVLKRQLPYFVCAVFSPPFRRVENLAYTEYFVIDIDHISDKGLLLSDVRRAIVADPRTVLCFVSPGGDGLKVLFRLSERCYDAGLYKTFYRLFLTNFSQQYRLGQVVDAKTCDVARACFMSMDEEAYYNPEAEKVVMAAYIDPEADVSQAFDLKHKMDEAEKLSAKRSVHVEPTGDVLAQIRETLGMERKTRKEKPAAYVPEILNDIMDNLRQYVKDHGVDLAEVVNIQYGKKLRFKIGMKQAEVNIFYGKRGFSVVQSLRTGTDAEANGLMVELVRGFLDGYM